MKKTTSTSLNEKCCETHFFFFFFALKYHGRQLLNYDFTIFGEFSPGAREAAYALISWQVPLTNQFRLISAEVTGHSPVRPFTQIRKVSNCSPSFFLKSVQFSCPANNDVIIRYQDGTRIIFSSRSSIRPRSTGFLWSNSAPAYQPEVTCVKVKSRGVGDRKTCEKYLPLFLFLTFRFCTRLKPLQKQ